MTDPTETEPEFVQSLPRGTRSVAAEDELELDPETQRDLNQRLDELDAARAAALVSGASYVVRGDSRG